MVRGTDPSSTERRAWTEVRFKSAVIASRRPSGDAWHLSERTSAGAALGMLLATISGLPAPVGRLLGSELDAESEPLAPAPYVVIRIAGEVIKIRPLGRSYSPAWDAPIAVVDDRFRNDEHVLLQVMDGVDDSLIGQKQLTLAELLEPGTHTIVDVGAVASLTFTTTRQGPRDALDAEFIVQGDRSGEAPSIEVLNGDHVEVVASGKVCPSSLSSRCADPDGIKGEWRSYNLRGGAELPHAALVAVSAEGVRLVGTHGRLRPNEPGRIVFVVNDTDSGNNSGAFRLRVRITPFGAIRAD